MTVRGSRAATSVPASSRSSTGLSGSIATLALGNAVPAVVSVISGPVLAQALDLEGRGQVAAAMAPFTLAVTLLTFGVPEAATYAVARNPHLARNVLRRSVVIMTLSGVAAAGAVLGLSGFLSGGDTAIQRLMVVAAAAIVPSLAIGSLRGVAQGRGRWRAVALEKSLSSVVKLAVLVPLWLTGQLTPLIATILFSALPLLGAFPYLAALKDAEPAASESPPEVRARGLFLFGLKVWAGSLAGVLLSRLDQTLITPLSDSDQAGLYAVAVTIGELPLLLSAAVRDVSFVKEADGSDDARLAQTARVATFVCTLMAAAVAAATPWLLPMLFGASFAPAVPVAIILLCAVVAGIPGSIAGSGLGGRGRPELRSISLVVACVVNGLAVVLLVPTFGALGAAIATLVGNQVAAGLNLVFGRRFLGMRILPFLGIRKVDLVLVLELGRRFAGRLVRAVRR